MTATPSPRTELKLVEQRLAAHLPLLGICLGAQIMAAALGSRVYAAPRKEIGWSPLEISDSGRESCLAFLEDQAVLHWHGDTFDLPQGARHLASTPACAHQAFSWGAAALALQFHVEVQPWCIERWLIGHACELAGATGPSVTSLRAASGTLGQGLVQAADRMVGAWLATVRER